MALKTARVDLALRFGKIDIANFDPATYLKKSVKKERKKETYFRPFLRVVQ